MPAPPAPSERRWLLPIAVLTLAALVIFWGLYALDFYLLGAGGRPGGHPLAAFFEFDPGSLTAAVSSLATMTAAVFGIVITVVSIIVQLSAERYTGVARMFLRDRVNLSVMAYYVVACVCGVSLSVALHHAFVPQMSLVVLLVATAFGL